MTPKPYGLMADLHLHNWTSFASEGDDGVNSRLRALLGEIERCAKVVNEAGGDTIVLAGDVFHVRGSVAPSVLNPAIDTIDEIHTRFGTKFFILPGNHDLEGKHSTRLGSSVTALSRGYVVVDVEPKYTESLQAVTFPWYEKTTDLLEHMWRAAPAPGAAPVDAIIHAPIDGVIAGLPLHGLNPAELAGLGYRHVFAGHYHHHKAFEGGVVSIGALAHHTWSDVDSKAGFLLVDPAAGSYRWFKSHLPEFIDLAKLAEQVAAEDVPLIVPGNYVRVKVPASKTKEVEEARQELLHMGALAVLVQAEPKPAADLVRAGHTVRAGASLEVSVSEFVNGMATVTDKDAVAKAALNVLGSIAVTH